MKMLSMKMLGMKTLGMFGGNSQLVLARRRLSTSTGAREIPFNFSVREPL
jgi:hypothetical protein